MHLGDQYPAIRRGTTDPGIGDAITRGRDHFHRGPGISTRPFPDTRDLAGIPVQKNIQGIFYFIDQGGVPDKLTIGLDQPVIHRDGQAGII
jgi:hypothetical protein